MLVREQMSFKDYNLNRNVNPSYSEDLGTICTLGEHVNLILQVKLDTPRMSLITIFLFLIH